MLGAASGTAGSALGSEGSQRDGEGAYEWQKLSLQNI